MEPSHVYIHRDTNVISVMKSLTTPTSRISEQTQGGSSLQARNPVISSLYHGPPTSQTTYNSFFVHLLNIPVEERIKKSFRSGQTSTTSEYNIYIYYIYKQSETAERRVLSASDTLKALSTCRMK